MRALILEIIGLGKNVVFDPTVQATANAIKMIQQIFKVVLLLSSALIIIGFLCNDAGLSIGPAIITIGALISIIDLIIALFVYGGPAWAILLIMNDTRQETQVLLKKIIMPLILFISLMNMSFLILPVANWGIKDLGIFVFAVTVASLSSLILDKDGRLKYQIFFAMTVIIFITAIVKMAFPVIVGNISQSLFTPVQSMAVGLTQTWWGSLLILLTIPVIVKIFLTVVRGINGEKTETTTTAATKTKKISLPRIKTIGTFIMTIAFWLGFFYIIWWAVDKEYPDLTNKATQVVAQGWAKGKKAVGQIQIPTHKTPPVKTQTQQTPAVPQPQPKTGKWVNGQHIVFHTGKYHVFKPKGYTLSFGSPVKISYDKKNWLTLNTNQEVSHTQTMFVEKISATNVETYWKKN